jgi:hypothetical protein
MREPHRHDRNADAEDAAGERDLRERRREIRPDGPDTVRVRERAERHRHERRLRGAQCQRAGRDRPQRQAHGGVRLGEGLGAEHEPEPRHASEHHARGDQREAAQQDVDEACHLLQREKVAAGDDVPVG